MKGSFVILLILCAALLFAAYESTLFAKAVAARVQHRIETQ